MSTVNRDRYTTRDAMSPAARAEKIRAALKSEGMKQLCVPDNLTFSADLLVKWFELIALGYFFKLGMSLKDNGFLLSIGRAGQSMRYEAFDSPDELWQVFENLPTE